MTRPFTHLVVWLEGVSCSKYMVLDGIMVSIHAPILSDDRRITDRERIPMRITRWCKARERGS